MPYNEEGTYYVSPVINLPSDENFALERRTLNTTPQAEQDKAEEVQKYTLYSELQPLTPSEWETFTNE